MLLPVSCQRAAGAVITGGPLTLEHVEHLHPDFITRVKWRKEIRGKRMEACAGVCSAAGFFIFPVEMVAVNFCEMSNLNSCSEKQTILKTINC